ncbi:imidazolonepropionase [Natronobacterium gregoryi]|uniref:Imidazolonepropionase n=2 Tax=Natronobacterium gregoryi TaxID=44930 RepID=L0AE14_NATGS|nr:imidazolonepropionase [Natronobacterium gregoryi]AFZ71392.1 imidazolonepropionase [Natronobacterium gregoryi SP2]ELY66917.1 imidazolonepropionase [Natronobacterium gregoryi SP2]PLK21229.1 imidazolonepropionase [Natronobacterium gregoryi SP2]SFI84771.1 imidazolonepropionase [Natronobacterium gregoryi]
MTPKRICVVYDASELVVGPGDDDPLEVREDAAVAAVDGEVVAVGDTDEVTREYPPENAEVAIDADGSAVVPGFVDPHTHAVFAGDRSDEFEARLRGKSYQEILEGGGGILRTVEATRKASADQLLENLCSHLDVMLAGGTTTVEVKSGYGLDAETELRLLEVVERANEHHPVDLVPTFLGAHAVPDGVSTDEYVDHVVDEQLPAVESQGIAEFCDVFCEEGVFDVSQSRRVLEAGREAGLIPKVHAEEFTRLGGSQLAADLEAASADHLLCATDADVEALLAAGVVPVLLPGTAFGLGEEYADAQAILEAGGPLAIATDFNPNCHARSMAFAQTLSCVEMGLTPAEALRAATSGAARALEREDGTGTLEVGAPADAVVLEAPSYAHLAYRFDTSAAETVVKDGEVVGT